MNVAEFVLIGLGREWIVTFDEMYADFKEKKPIFAQLLDFILGNEEYAFLLGPMEWFYNSAYIPYRFERAYQALYDLVNQRNYFIVSLTTDSYLRRFRFKTDRCVNPCGTLENMQCECDCNHELLETGAVLESFMSIIHEMEDENDYISQNTILRYAELLSDSLAGLKCKKCQEGIVFNTLDAVKYNENGYLDNWHLYMEWLQGTVNRKLCIVEAGVGMELPAVIRWPFEKTAFYNKKATMIRVHHKFYQINKEISDRAYGINKNAVEFFNKNSWRQ